MCVCFFFDFSLLVCEAMLVICVRYKCDVMLNGLVSVFGIAYKWVFS